MQSSTTRRDLLAGGAAALGAVGCETALRVGDGPARRGGIRQSIVQWCFADHWDVEQTCRVAADLGCKSVEVVPPEHWPTLKRYGLTCALAPIGMPAPPFMRGFNNPRYQEQVIAATRTMIDACAEAGVPSVIAFTGYKWRDAADPSSGEIPPDEGASNCVTAFRRVAGHAEKRGVTICLEMLNTRASDHPMKGHPGYQGDHIDYCLEIVKRVGSPRVKLLFDIYHVQIMDGDVIRRVHECKDHIGHVHTAGNPGRGELDDTQEINYPPIMRALLDIGFDGYVGQEFIPTRDPRAGLEQAVRLCDV